VDHNKLVNPDELLALTSEQLFRRVRPILRAGGLLASSQLLARVRQNLNSVCWELGEKWKANPRHGDRQVAFSEYLAITLSKTLWSFDRKQNRHLYDENGVYQLGREPVVFDEFDAKCFSFRPEASTTPDRLSADTWAQSLEVHARNGSIAQPSVAALIQNIRDVESGRTKTPYKLARSEGRSTTDARYHPATGHFIAITDFIADYSATVIATAIA